MASEVDMLYVMHSLSQFEIHRNHKNLSVICYPEDKKASSKHAGNFKADITLI